MENPIKSHGTMKGLRDEIASLKRTNIELSNACQIGKENYEKVLEDEKSANEEAMKKLQDEIELHKRNYAELNVAFDELLTEKRNLEKCMQTKDRMNDDETKELQEEIEFLKRRNAALNASVNELQKKNEEYA